jgi:hypothetical protein
MDLIKTLSGFGLQWSWRNSWFTAKNDHCKLCGTMRINHVGKDHKFKEDECSKS